MPTFGVMVIVMDMIIIMERIKLIHNIFYQEFYLVI